MRKLFSIFAIFFTTLSFGNSNEQIDFFVELPNGWDLVSYSEADRLWVYEPKSKENRLTVSVLYYSQEPNYKQQAEFLKDFVVIRKQQSLKKEPNISFEPEELKEYPAAWVLQYGEASNDTRFAKTKIISTKIGIANFYFESFSDLKTHEELSKKVLATTGFSS